MKPLLTILLTFILSGACIFQDYKVQRENMVSQQIEARGIDHKATLAAMRKVERHLFVPPEVRKFSYDDTALPIGLGQTISQPFIVATMTQLLNPQPSDRVLEIGTGSGYQAAVLAGIVKEVYTIEIVTELGERSKELLERQGYRNVKVIIGDGYKGLKEKAPFDGIIVTAAPEEIPPPLIEQLKEGGRMVIPVGAPRAVQTLMLVEKRKGKIVKKHVTEVRFVPFTREKQ
ncbi:protein-L-isoaspartate(D-aspartate) O-methyltransferase [Flavihumibacter sp. R14]|nr:protein-L-isoaspartate(D-aspartate) O-methyltransferase [Flavihumibacter soli]